MSSKWTDQWYHQLGRRGDAFLISNKHIQTYPDRLRETEWPSMNWLILCVNRKSSLVSLWGGPGQAFPQVVWSEIEVYSGPPTLEQYVQYVPKYYYYYSSMKQGV